MFFNNAMPDDYKSLSGIIVTKEKSKTLEEAEESTEMKVIKKKMRADYFPLACMHAQQVLTKTYLDKQHFLHQKKNERRLFIVAELTHTPNASL